MKNTLLLLFLITLVSFTTTQQQEDLIGRWKGDSKGEIGYISFDKDGYASFEVKGEIIGGKEFELDGKKGSMTYEVDMDTTPIEITFTVTKFDTNDHKKFYAILSLEDKDNITIALDATKKPTDFNGERTMKLKRVK